MRPHGSRPQRRTRFDCGHGGKTFSLDRHCLSGRVQCTTLTRGRKAERPPDPPVRTVELTASHDAVKLEGVATILNTDALLQLDARYTKPPKSLRISAVDSLPDSGLSTMLSRQTLDNAERQAGIDASQLKLLETRLRQTWGEKLRS